nr:unnamed protein product [Callosobruchus chinensis]
METTVGAINSGSRKKPRKVSQREQEKRQRYSNADPNLTRFVRPCNHDTKAYKCNLVKPSDIKKARNNFYEEPSKTVQDQKLCNLISILEPKRRRPKEGILAEKRKTKSVRVVYFLRVYKGNKAKTLTVCRNFFLAVFGNVKALLEKQFNNADMQWQNLPSLEFFKPILDEGSKEAEQEYVEENEPIDDEACDCLEDDLELHL